MTKIIRHNREINFSRVVAYGCSFTAGTELADHEYFQGLSAEQVDDLKRKIGIEKFYLDLYTSRSAREIVDAREQQLVWPKWFSDYFNVDYLNRAKSGSSNQATVYTIERDLADDIIRPDDLIVVGITSPQRWFWFRENAVPLSPNFGFAPDWPSQSFHDEFIKTVGNDYFILYNLYQSMKYLDMLSDRLDGRLVMQFVHHPANDYVEWMNVSEDFRFMFNSHNNFKSIVDVNYSFGNIINWDADTHGFCHPKADFHKQFGHNLAVKFSQHE